MSEEERQDSQNENFEELLEQSLSRSDSFTPGEKVTGTIVQIGKENVFVDISGKSEAVIDLSEFLDDDENLTVEINDPVEAYVVSDSGGEIRLTTRFGRGQINNTLIRLAYENRIPVHATIQKVVKGGYSLSLSGIRCFCPFSQIDMKPTADPEELVSTSSSFLIIEYDRKGKNIVLSRRALQEERMIEAEKDLKETLSIGDTISGTVQSIQNFGIFLDIGGIEGLIPKSELSWSRAVDVKSYSDGDVIETKVIDLDWENKKITLSVKALSEDPWEHIDSYERGNTHTGTVVNLIKTGAFVEIAPGLEGYIHVSRMSLVKKVNRPEEVLSFGDRVMVRITGIKKDERKISLELVTDEPDPWLSPAHELKKAPHAGIVESARKNGIHVRLANGMLGFAPKDDLLAKDETDLQKKYPTGTEVTVAIKDLDSARKMCILSERMALKLEERKDFEKFMGEQDGDSGSNLGSLFKNEFDKIQDKLEK